MTKNVIRLYITFWHLWVNLVQSYNVAIYIIYLYVCILYRPCFGSFGPEIVETVGQALEQAGDKDNYQFTVDTNFIGKL